MKTGWYKGVNPRLERLTKMLGNSKPSHGYTISEDAPEIVTAPGVYFPAEKGEVIPLKPRREGGEVTPSLHKDNDRAKLEMVHGILSKVHPGGLEHHAMKGLAMSPESMKIEKSKYDILKSALSVLKPAKVSGGDREPKSIKTTPRQNGGEVIPTPEKDPLLKPEESVTDISSTSPLDNTNEYLRQLTTMFSRADGGDVEPPMINESEDEKLRRVLNIGPPLTPTQVELAERRKWATPGVPEGILSATREKLGPNVVSVTPGFQRSYYDAHPEERLMEQIDAANKPSIDVAQKLIEDARTRAQGFGVGFNKGRFEKGVGAQERMAAARTELPGLMQGLERLQGTASQAKAGVLETLFKPQPEEKAPAPHLIQDESGQYTWVTPGGVLPAGVMGKPTPPRSVTNEELVRGDLRNQLKREPTEGEVLNEIDKRKLNLQMGGIPPMSPEAARVPSMTGVKNDTALEGLTPEQQSVVKKLASYELPIPGSFAMKDPKWQALLGRTAAYDTSFDATQYAVRQKLRQDFTSGKSANNIRSLNTAIGHLDTLSTKANALSNAPLQIWNAIKNKGLTATGDKRVTEFNAAATAVESELANVFKGMGASDQEIKAWRQNLSTSQSPEQLKGAIDTAIELLGGRLGALQSQYEAGLGRPKDFRFLSDKSRSILKKLGANVDALDSSAGVSSTPEQTWKLKNGTWTQE